MNKAARTELEVENERYLEKFNIFGLFQQLTEQLVISKPPDPLGLVISILEKPSSKVECYLAQLVAILTPPGSRFAHDSAADLTEQMDADFINFHKQTNSGAQELTVRFYLNPGRPSTTGQHQSSGRTRRVGSFAQRIGPKSIVVWLPKDRETSPHASRTKHLPR